MEYDNELIYGKLISAIHRKALQIVKYKLKDYDIDVGQIFLLWYIHHHDGISQEQAAQNFHLDKATVSKNVKRLMRLGYLRKSVNPKDLREHQLFATKKAKTLSPQLEAILKDINLLMINNVSKEEQAQLISTLEKVLKNIEVCDKG
ncbi:MAG: MarR family transcriptional regulator [Bacteroidales bacterium]|nr:MarR family transcriptional regulator [Bacteroidales bacterium]